MVQPQAVPPSPASFKQRQGRAPSLQRVRLPRAWRREIPSSPAVGESWGELGSITTGFSGPARPQQPLWTSVGGWVLG